MENFFVEEADRLCKNGMESRECPFIIYTIDKTSLLPQWAKYICIPDDIIRYIIVPYLLPDIQEFADGARYHMTMDLKEAFLEGERVLSIYEQYPHRGRKLFRRQYLSCVDLSTRAYLKILGPPKVREEFNEMETEDQINCCCVIS